MLPLLPPSSAVLPQILVELAELQDQEVGDGTTSVVIVASELLKRANDLVRAKIHPTSIIAGFRLAMREACKYIEEQLSIPVESLGQEALMNAARTAMSSKIVGADADFYARIVVDAVKAVKTSNSQGQVRYPVKAINILKAHGKSTRDSSLLDGYALNLGRAAQVGWGEEAGRRSMWWLLGMHRACRGLAPVDRGMTSLRHRLGFSSTEIPPVHAPGNGCLA